MTELSTASFKVNKHPNFRVHQFATMNEFFAAALREDIKFGEYIRIGDAAEKASRYTGIMGGRPSFIRAGTPGSNQLLKQRKEQLAAAARWKAQEAADLADMRLQSDKEPKRGRLSAFVVRLGSVLKRT